MSLSQEQCDSRCWMLSPKPPHQSRALLSRCAVWFGDKSNCLICKICIHTPSDNIHTHDDSSSSNIYSINNTSKSKLLWRMKMIHIVFYSRPIPKILFWLSGNKRRCYGDTGYLLGSVGRSDIELDGDICKQARGNCCVGICLIDPIKILSPPRATIKYQMTYGCYATIRYAVILGSKVMT